MRQYDEPPSIDLTIGPGDGLHSTQASVFARRLLIGVRQLSNQLYVDGWPFMDQLHCPPAVAYALESSFMFLQLPYSHKAPNALQWMIGHAANLDVHVDRGLGERQLRLSISPQAARQARLSAVLHGTAPETEVTVAFTTNFDLV